MDTTQKAYIRIHKNRYKEEILINLVAVSANLVFSRYLL